MTTTRRFFTDEFKREAVAVLESSGRPLEPIAKELGIQPSMLRTWRRRVLVAAILNDPEPHFRGSEKILTVFFSMSRSMRTRSSSRFKRAISAD